MTKRKKKAHRGYSVRGVLPSHRGVCVRKGGEYVENKTLSSPLSLNCAVGWSLFFCGFLCGRHKQREEDVGKHHTGVRGKVEETEVSQHTKKFTSIVRVPHKSNNVFTKDFAVLPTLQKQRQQSDGPLELWMQKGE